MGMTLWVQQQMHRGAGEGRQHAPACVHARAGGAEGEERGVGREGLLLDGTGFATVLDAAVDTILRSWRRAGWSSLIISSHLRQEPCDLW